MPMIFVFTLLLLCSQAFAGEKVTEFQDAASMGRGDTTTSWSNSPSVDVFYNPSFANDRQEFSFSLIDLSADAGQKTIGVISHIPSFNQGSLYPEVLPYFGNSYQAQGLVSPTFSYKGFVFIPFFTAGLASATVSDPVFSNADAYYYYDYGTALAKGVSITDKFSIGASAILYHRHGAMESADLSNVLKHPAEDDEYGKALSLNLGANYKLHDSYDTTFGLDLRNIGSPSFWTPSGNNPEESKISSLYQELDFGFSSRFFPVPYFDKRIKWALEFHNITDDNYSFLNKASLGLQYDVFSWLNLKGGVYETYGTYGIGIKTGIVSLDLSSYGENSGIGYDTQNRHYDVGLKLGFNLQ
jgi:hypothetical protein